MQSSQPPSNPPLQSPSSHSPLQSPSDTKQNSKELKPHNSPRLGGIFEKQKLKPIDTAPLALNPRSNEENIGPTPKVPLSTTPSS